MDIGSIRGANFVYRAPEGLENCKDLRVRVDEVDGQRWITSAWIPTPEEVQRLVSGQPIHLHIMGNNHPVVAMSVPQD